MAFSWQFVVRGNMSSRPVLQNLFCCFCNNGSKSIGINSLHTAVQMRSDHTSSVQVFDRKSKRLQRDRAAQQSEAHLYDYLKEEVGYRLADRIYDIKREFKNGLDLGCGRGFVAKNINDSMLSHLHMSDMSAAMLDSAQVPESVPYTKVVIDEEETFPFQSNKFDIILSNLSLHWVNNLPGCLKEVNRVIQEEGVFLASMFSGDTLYQLRSSLVLAELEREGGFAMHISPFTENRDIGGLLTQAGFSMLTVDTEEITVGYPTMFELMWDLQGMAENNAAFTRKLHLHRDTLLSAAAIYQEMYGTEEGIPATFQITYMIGWKPDAKQPIRTAKRGSGQVSMKDIDKLDEMIKKFGMQGKIKFMDDMVKDSNNDDNNKK